MYKICTVIPVYNEAERLETKLFTEYAATHKKNALLFVNDGSTDDSIAAINKIIEVSKANVFLLNMPNNKGKAEAIRHGFNWAFSNLDFTTIGYLDADLATPLSEVEYLNSAFDSKDVIMAFGSRVKLQGNEIQRNLKRHYLGRIFATFVSVILGLDIYDTQCGAKYFRNTELNKNVFNEEFVSKWFFDLEIFLRLQKLLPKEKFKSIIKEIPLNIWEEKGESKLTLMDFITTPFELIKIKRNSKK